MEALTTAMTEGFTTVAGNVTSMMLVALPIGLGVVGIKLASKYGIKFFKDLLKG